MMGSLGWYYLKRVSLVGLKSENVGKGWNTDVDTCSYADGKE